MNPFPLSHPQRRIWFAQNQHPESNVNSFAGLLELPTASLEAVEAAWNQVVESVDGFRLRILPHSCPGDDFPACQQVVPFSPVQLPERRFTSWEEADRYLEETFAQPIPLHGQLVFPTAIRVEGAANLYLFINFHHIVSDGWSYDLTLRYVLAHFDGKAVPKTRYQDFVELERAYLDSAQRVADRTYWMGCFAEEVEAVKLSFSGDRSEPFSQGFVLAESVLEKARAYALTSGLSLYKQFTTAFSVVAARLARVDRFALAFANHNRSQKSLFGTCGMFVSTLPQVVEYHPESSFERLCRSQAQELELAIKEHSRYPFDLLVSECRRELGLDISGLTKLSLVGHPDRKREDRPYLGSTAEGLAIHFNQDGRSKQGHLSITFHSDGKEVSRSDCAVLFEALETVWSEALERPQAPLSTLWLTSPPQWSKLQSFNARTTEVDLEHHLWRRLTEQAKARPEEVAVVASNGTLSWRELLERSEKVACRLLNARGKSSLRGEFVGLCLHRDRDLMPGILGVLRSGAAYVPLDPEYPKSRLEFMIQDAGIEVVLADSEFEPLLRGTTLVDPKAEVEPRELPSLESFSAEDRAYAIYTSGTTGTPKGVPIRHGQLSHLISTIREPFGLTESSIALLYASLNFDASVVELFATLANGSRLVICDEKTRLDSGALLQLLREQKVSWATLPPALLAVLPATELPALQTLVVAGESTDPGVIERWSKGRSMLNGYGPTENTVATTVGDFASASSSQDIGQPLPNHRCYVLDRGMMPVPLGVPGELFVAAPTVSEGYLNRPDLTAEKFFEDPFTAPSDSAVRSRMYRTGDLVRWLPSGRLEFIGRVDFQVKIRGHRIECQEIATSLSQLEGIKACIVIPLPSGATHKLVAYLLAEASWDSSRLRDAAQKRLPDYMVPSAFVLLDDFPRTPAGKIDRRALPAPAFSEQDEVSYLAPESEEEILLTTIWQEVLGLEKVGVLHNFYHLGGDSLLALRMLSAAEEKGLRLTLEELRNGPTVRELAAAASRGDDGLLTLTHREADFPLPLPRNALMMVRQEEAMAASGVHSPLILGTWTLKGALDVEKMLGALNALRQRHEVFRLRLVGDLLHRVERLEPLECRELEQTQIAEVLAQEQALDPLRPDCRFSFFRLAPDLHLIANVCSHELMDAWARGILEKEMVALYNGEPLGPAYGFSDFALWYDELLRSQALESSRRYWQELLDGARPLFAAPPQPADVKRPYDTVMLLAPLQAEILEAFGTRCKGLGATLFEGLYTAFHLSLSRRTGRSDVLTGYVTALRGSNALQSVVGGLTNRLYLSTSFEPETGFESALAQTQRALADNQRHSLWPAWTAADQGGSGFPGVFFHYVPRPDSKAAEFSGLERVPSSPPRPTYWPLGLAFQVVDHPSQPSLCLLGRKGFIDEPFGERCMADFTDLLSRLSAKKGETYVLTRT